MKLLYCLKCHDVVSLRQQPRTCSCGVSGGNYHQDELKASYFGPCIPLVFNNQSLDNALTNQPKEGKGLPFEAVVVPEICDTFKKITR